MTSKPSSPFMTWGHWGVSGILVFAIGTVICVLVALLRGEQQGWIAGGFAGALVALVRISWPLRYELWFWALVSAFAVGDILSVIFIDWSFAEKWTGNTFGGLVTVDIMMMMAIVYAIYRRKYGVPKVRFEESPDDGPSYAARDLDL